MEQRICRSVSTESQRFREFAREVFFRYIECPWSREFAVLSHCGAANLQVCVYRVPAISRVCRGLLFLLHRVPVEQGICSSEPLWSSEFAGLCLPSPSDFGSCPGITFSLLRVPVEQGICSSELLWSSEFAGLCLPTVGDFGSFPVEGDIERQWSRDLQF